MAPPSAYGRSIDSLRGMTPDERIRKSFALGEAVRDLFRVAEQEVAPTLPSGDLEGFLQRHFKLSHADLLNRIVGSLDRAGIDYFLTGSLASSVYGEPRIVKDLDVTVRLAESRVSELLAAYLGPDFRPDPKALGESIRGGGIFVSELAGDRVDFWFFQDDPFDRSRFERKRCVRLVGLDVNVPSPEDAILANLRWAKKEVKGSEVKSYRDALRITEVQDSALDRRYLTEWADRLEVRALWDRVLADMTPL
jgi:hypothetical protein